MCEHECCGEKPLPGAPALRELELRLGRFFFVRTDPRRNILSNCYLGRDGRFSGRFVMVGTIRRFSRFLSEATDMPCKRTWGAMCRRSMVSHAVDLGQRVEAATS